MGLMTKGTRTDRYRAMNVAGKLLELFVTLVTQIRNRGDQVDLARETPLLSIAMAGLTAQARFVLIPDDLGRAIGIRRSIGVDRVWVCRPFEFPFKGRYPIEEKDQRFMPLGLITAEHKEQGKGHHRQTYLYGCQLC